VYDGEKLSGSSDRVKPDRYGKVVVNCEVTGGYPEPEIKLFSGSVLIQDADEDDCDDKVDRHSKCVTFEFTPQKNHLGADLNCVAILPGIDPFKEDDKSVAGAILDVDECELHFYRVRKSRS
jgi:hypothetical protein